MLPGSYICVQLPLVATEGAALGQVIETLIEMQEELF